MGIQIYTIIDGSVKHNGYDGCEPLKDHHQKLVLDFFGCYGYIDTIIYDDEQKILKGLSPITQSDVISLKFILSMQRKQKLNRLLNECC